MKQQRKALGFVLVLCLSFIIGAAVLAAKEPTTAAAAVTPKVVVNGEAITFPDAQPFLDSNNRTQVPVRFVTEALNAKVDWNASTKTVTVTRGPVVIKMTIGNTKYSVTDNPNFEMDTAPQLKESRTFVPLRFVAQALGAEVSWDAATATATIKDSGEYIYMIGDFKVPISDTDEIEGDRINGIAIYKGSGLKVVGGGNDGDVVGMRLDINFSEGRTDLLIQREETKDILKRTLGEKTVNEIMDHVNKKQKDTDKLELLVTYEGKYTIAVSSAFAGPIVIFAAYDK